MVYGTQKYKIFDCRVQTAYIKLSTKYDEYYEKEVPNAMGGLPGALTQSGEEVGVKEQPLYSFSIAATNLVA